jgi:putative aldouronate transport system substrate-binding protein
MTRNSFNRRLLIKSAGIAGAASLAPRITFARQDASPAASPAGPVAQGTPDANGYYPSGVPGVADAYTKVPTPFASTDGPPGSGGTVKALVMTYSAPPPGKDDNQYWQELDKRLGVSWEPILVPNSTYGEKATAIIASGDFPDLFYLNYNQTLSPLANFVQQGAFLDLTPYVTGDAIKEYPNLAVFPDFMWEATKLDGKIYGVPCPGGRAGQIPFLRTDWANKLGGGIPTNAEETATLFSAMSANDPDGNGQADTWAMGRYGTSWDNGLMNPMFRVPNNWRVNDDGTFTSEIETDEYRMAVEFMQQLYASGAYHPDSAAMQFEQALQLFQSGRTGLHVDGGAVYGSGGYNETIRQYQPEASVEYLIPYGHDGQPAVTYNLPGIFGFTAIPITVGGDEDRVHELLRIFNWLSAPFGSEEWLFKGYGIEGVHFDYDAAGTPIKNDLYDQENGGLTGYIGGSLGVNFVDTDPSIGPVMTDIQKKTYEIGIDDPAANLFSPASIKNGPTMSQLVADTLTAIVTGRDDLSSLDTMIADWKSRGGDEVRKEYEEAYSKNQG